MDHPDPEIAFRGTPPAKSLPAWSPELLASVTEHVSTGHHRAVAAANGEVIAAYWSIGRAILDRQDEEGYGMRVVDRLSADLRDRFPGARGYSPRNLKYMRRFAEAWPDWEVVQRGVAQPPWRHQIALVEKLDEPEHRLWYAAAALDQGWSRDVLALHIEQRLHERSGKAITNFGRTLPAPTSDLAQQATRDRTCSTSCPPPTCAPNGTWSGAWSSTSGRSFWNSAVGSRSSDTRSAWSSATGSSSATCCSSTPSCGATSSSS